MCKPKSQGGQRCLTHIKQQQQSFAERIARKQELAANNHLPPSRRAKAQRELEALQEKHEAVSEELMTAEKRAAEREATRDTRQQKKTLKASAAVTTGELQRHQRLSLTAKELQLVKEDAAKKGITVNALFRDRFNTRWDNLRVASAGELPHQVSESESVGRKPISTSGSLTQPTSIGLTHETLRSIEVESKAFKLTPSTYIRRIMLQQDPRQRGADTSRRRADDDRATLAFIEEREGITTESSVEEIAEAWQKHLTK